MATRPDTLVPAVGSGTMASTPVVVDVMLDVAVKAELPITSEPGDAVPVAAAGVCELMSATETCRRAVAAVVE